MNAPRTGPANGDLLSDDIEAIRALARIPRTPDGPDWAKASTDDARLAIELIRQCLGYAESLIKKEIRQHDGAVPYRERNRVEGYKDNSGSDWDEGWKHPDEATQRFQRTGCYAESNYHDLLSALPIWIHEAAVRFDGRVSWRGWLSVVIPSRVKDRLRSKRVAGTADHGDGPKPDPITALIEDWGLSELFADADREVRATGDQVLIDYFCHRKSMTRIARRLGISVAAISKQIKAARKKLPHFNNGALVRRLAVDVSNGKALASHWLTFLMGVRTNIRKGGDETFDYSAPTQVHHADPDIVDLIREACQRRELTTCKLPDGLSDYTEQGHIVFKDGPDRQQAADPWHRQPELAAWQNGEVLLWSYQDYVSWRPSQPTSLKFNDEPLGFGKRFKLWSAAELVRRQTAAAPPPPPPQIRGVHECTEFIEFAPYCYVHTKSAALLGLTPLAPSISPEGESLCCTHEVTVSTEPQN